MPPRFGTPIPSPSLDALVAEARDKIRRGAIAKAEAKESGPSSAPTPRAAHPMSVRPRLNTDGVAYAVEDMTRSKMRPPGTSRQPTIPSSRASPMMSLNRDHLRKLSVGSSAAACSTSQDNEPACNSICPGIFFDCEVILHCDSKGCDFEICGDEGHRCESTE